MKYFKFAKLVRDRIPDHMKADGQELFETRNLADDEYVKELSRKVIEEAKELGNAEDVESLKEELADVQEIIDCLKKTIKMDDADIKKYQENKILKNGGFDKKVYIGYIGCEENSKWTEYYLKNQDRYPELVNPKKLK